MGWKRRGIAVVVVAVLLAAGLASLAGAATGSSDAADASDAVVDELDARLSAAERRCLAKELRAEPDLATAVLEADGDLDAVDPTTAGELVGLVVDCAPDALLHELAGEGIFEELDAPTRELRCFAENFGSLDTTVLAAAVGDAELEELSPDDQNQVFELIFDCMPVTMGRAMYGEIAASAKGVPDEPTDRQAMCIGEGIADTLADAGGAVVLAGDDPPPEVVGSMMGVMADCTPDVLVTLLATSLRGGDVSKKAATCIATALVEDPDAMEAMIVADATDGTTPREFREIEASCR